MLSKKDLSDKNKYPAYSADSTNNGIVGYTNIPEFICDEKHPIYITFGDHTRTFNIAKESFSVLDNVKVLLPITNSYRSLLWIVTAWQKQIPNLGYARHWKIAKDIVIELPTKNEKIDFDFMENFIAELEARHIAKLEAYLSVTGLKDYNLSRNEQEILSNYLVGKIELKEYCISELFEIESYQKRFDANKVTVADSGNFPYVVRMSTNNGQKGFIDEDKEYLNAGNTISFGQDTATMFYQEKPYFTGDKIKILKPKYKKFSKENAHFFITAMSKSFCNFSWGSSSFNVKIIKNQKIILPIKEEKIDFETMEILILAIKKIIIKDLVFYCERKIPATQKVLSNQIKIVQ